VPVPDAIFKEEYGPLKVSSLVFGGGSMSNFYNSDTLLASETPLRAIRLALRYVVTVSELINVNVDSSLKSIIQRYGIRSIDTSAYYGPSEIVIGTALKALEIEFPRSSYQLVWMRPSFSSYVLLI